MNRPTVSRTIIDRALDIAREVEVFASFDHPTRRFIAYAIWQVPELRILVNAEEGVAGNAPLPLLVGEHEVAERAAAYGVIPELRACTAKGAEGQRQRRLHFGALLEPAKVDLRYKRLTSLPAFLFCYERLVGPAWRQLLPLAWQESVLQRRKKVAPRQLPLDPRLREDSAVPILLEDEPAPWFFPSMTEADAAGGAPLLNLL